MIKTWESKKAIKEAKQILVCRLHVLKASKCVYKPSSKGCIGSNCTFLEPLGKVLKIQEKMQSLRTIEKNTTYYKIR